MLDPADLTHPETPPVGQRALVDATLARIGPPYGRVLADEEYARICRHLRLLGCGEPAVAVRDGEVYHAWIIEGRVRLRMYSRRGQPGDPLAQGWLAVE
jgi:hypothetical protein